MRVGRGANLPQLIANENDGIAELERQAISAVAKSELEGKLQDAFESICDSGGVQKLLDNGAISMDEERTNLDDDDEVMRLEVNDISDTAADVTTGEGESAETRKRKRRTTSPYNLFFERISEGELSEPGDFRCMLMGCRHPAVKKGTLVFKETPT